MSASQRRTTPRRSAVGASPPTSAGSDKKKKKSTASADASWQLPQLSESILSRPPERWVCVHFKLQHISLLDDVVRLPPNATLHTLEAKLITHHGGAVKGIELYKDDAQPKNKLRDFSLTLKEAFVLDDARPSTVPYPNIPSSSGVGAAMMLSPEDHHVTVCYDFKSHDSDCPLLNRSPRYRSGTGLDNNAAGSGGHSSSSQPHHSSLARSLGSPNSATTPAAAAASSSSQGGGEKGAASTSGSSSGGVGLSAPLSTAGGESGSAAVGVGGGGSSTRS